MPSHSSLIRTAQKVCTFCATGEQKLKNNGFFIKSSGEPIFLVLVDRMEDVIPVKDKLYEFETPNFKLANCRFGFAIKCDGVSDKNESAQYACGVWTRQFVMETRPAVIVCSDIALAQLGASDRLKPFATVTHQAFGLVTYIPPDQLLSEEAEGALAALGELVNG